MIVYDPAAPTVLVYPLPAAEGGLPHGDVLGALLGRTRAAVLLALRAPAGTTVLAERTGISPASTPRSSVAPAWWSPPARAAASCTR
jgi:hypothetical protein